MERDRFKLIHSELIQQVQCTEHNLRIIYAAMCEGDFGKNLKRLERANLGKIASELRKLDFSDDLPELTEADYQTIDDIRNIRNYWCHQCYLDFVYIQDDWQREQKFQEIANRLHFDEFRTYELSRKTEKLRLAILKKYR